MQFTRNLDDFALNWLEILIPSARLTWLEATYCKYPWGENVQVKTWKSDFHNGFGSWTVEKDSPWIIEKWEILKAKYNQSCLHLPAKIPNNDHIFEGVEKKEINEVWLNITWRGFFYHMKNEMFKNILFTKTISFFFWWCKK